MLNTTAATLSSHTLASPMMVLSKRLFLVDIYKYFKMNLKLWWYLGRDLKERTWRNRHQNLNSCWRFWAIHDRLLLRSTGNSFILFANYKINCLRVSARTKDVTDPRPRVPSDEVFTTRKNATDAKWLKPCTKLHVERPLPARSYVNWTTKD